MIREAQDSGRTIGDIAEDFGFSRTAYYAIKEGFDADGMLAFIPEKKGPRGQYKLTEPLKEFIDEYAAVHPKASSAVIAGVILSEKGVGISKRTIERYRLKKKPL